MVDLAANPLVLSAKTEARILTAFMTLFFLVAMRQVPRIWRHETTYYDEMQAWWLWGEALWRALTRCMAFGVTVGFTMSAWGLLAAFSLDLNRDVAPLWWGIPAGAILALGASLLTTITLFNWPKRAVPPHMRDQPGTIVEWRDARVKKKQNRYESSP